MIYMDVDAALSEVPVNLLPLLDDDDFVTIKTAIAYNEAGMALYWHFVTTAGAYSATAVTPTTSGTYDWAHQAQGMYTIEIPASGGASINNDTEGHGWFTGVATDVLPWRGPTICFRAAALNNLLIDDAYSTTRGLAGTALPNAAADAAGGLPISDAGGLDLDSKLANTNEVTAARMGALTDWINGGRLDLILDIIAADTTTDIPAKLVKYISALARKDAALFADLATELGEINQNYGSGAGAYSNLFDSQEASRDEAVTAASTLGTAVANVAVYASRTVVRGTVGTATTPSTTQFTPSALSPSGVAADQFKGRILVWDNDTTTTALRGQATDITASSAAALPLFTFTALTTAPANGDTFSIV